LLVTGASGFLGAVLAPLAGERHDVNGLTRDELDVTDERSVRRVVRELSPDAVLHCAAYTDVDGAERHSDLAMKVNAEAVRFVAEAAREQNATMVYVSTDYVFDGETSTPYDEEAAVRPLSIYGASKLEGERRVAEACSLNWLTVRTGWLYGSRKGFVDWVRKGLARGEKLPLIEDQKGSPTYVVELAEAILRLVEGGHRGLFHFVNRGGTSWVELGRAVSEELGIAAPRFRPICARELGRPAPRPAYSVLAVDKYEEATDERVRPWREALKRYLADN